MFSLPFLFFRNKYYGFNIIYFLFLFIFFVAIQKPSLPTINLQKFKIVHRSPIFQSNFFFFQLQLEDFA